MTERQGLGRWGEEEAAAFLQREGYEVLARNYRTPWGEIDIIAREGETLVFVEVRARRGRAFGAPEESLTPRKGRRLLLSALHYIEEQGKEGPWRIDLVAVQARGWGKRPSLTLYRNAWTGEAPPW